jgi:hypothetical protein
VQARPPMPDGQAKGMLIQELIYCFVFFRWRKNEYGTNDARTSLMLLCVVGRIK